MTQIYGRSTLFVNPLCKLFAVPKILTSHTPVVACMGVPDPHCRWLRRCCSWYHSLYRSHMFLHTSNVRCKTIVWGAYLVSDISVILVQDVSIALRWWNCHSGIGMEGGFRVERKGDKMRRLWQFLFPSFHILFLLFLGSVGLKERKIFDNPLDHVFNALSSFASWIDSWRLALSLWPLAHLDLLSLRRLPWIVLISI